MKKLAFILVVLVLVTSTFAVAADQRTGVKLPVQMSDAEMAQVVAGNGGPPPIGSGYYLDRAVWELINFTYTLDFLSPSDQHLIESKLLCIQSLFNRGIKSGSGGNVGGV